MALDREILSFRRRRIRVWALYSPNSWGLGIESEWRLPQSAWFALMSGPFAIGVEYRMPLSLVPVPVELEHWEYEM